MRKLFVALAAAAAFGLAVPISDPAEAQTSTTVVVKKRGADRYGHRPHRKVTVIKSDRRRGHVHSYARSTKVVIKKKRTPSARVMIRAN